MLGLLSKLVYEGCVLFALICDGFALLFLEQPRVSVGAWEQGNTGFYVMHPTKAMRAFLAAAVARCVRTTLKSPVDCSSSVS